MNTTRGLHSIDTALLARRLPNCAANDTELGPCTAWCGKRICALRDCCVRPIVPVKRTLWGRFQRWARIRDAAGDLAWLEDQYREIALSGRYTGDQLRKARDKVGAARVNLSLAQRP